MPHFLLFPPHSSTTGSHPTHWTQTYSFNKLPHCAGFSMPWVPGSPGGREYHQSEELFFTLHTVLADASKLIGLTFFFFRSQIVPVFNKKLSLKTFNWHYTHTLIISKDTFLAACLYPYREEGSLEEPVKRTHTVFSVVNYKTLQWAVSRERLINIPCCI